MSAIKPASRITAKQAAADKANLAKARAKLKGRPRTAKQIAASRRNLAVARAAQKARAAGKTPVTRKAVQAPYPGGYGDLLFDAAGLHKLPACGPVAAAEHLAVMTGIHLPPASLLELHRIVQPSSLADLLEYLRAEGFPGTRVKLAYFEQCDTDSGVPGLLVGARIGRGYHAVVSYPNGMAASWEMLLPQTGTPEEAWWLEWEDE